MPVVHRFTQFAAVLLLVSGIASNTAAQAANSFKPLEFLVGSCWTGAFPDGKQTDTHCFEWIYNRKFIRDRHEVRGGPPYSGESTYYVDAKSSVLSYWYISSEALVLTGTVETAKDDVVFPSRYSTPTGDVEMRAIWTPVDANSYKVRSLQRSGDGWKELWSMVMKRANK